MAILSIVSATRHTEEDFFRQTWLGRSLERFKHGGQELQLKLFAQNQQGLSAIYNSALKQIDPLTPALFIHDDVSLQDLFLVDKIQAALQQFDLVGVAGGSPPRGAIPPSWFHPDWDLSGFIAQGKGHNVPSELTPLMIDRFGPTPHHCRFLDGVFLAMVPARIHAAGIAFDEQFDFHHYDLDFCISAMEKGLRLGTWPIWIAHASLGRFNTPAWEKSAERFQQKYPSQGSKPDVITHEMGGTLSEAKPYSLNQLTLIQDAAALKKAGQLHAALLKYEQVISDAQSFPEVWFNYGNLLQQLGRHDNAEEAFNRAISMRESFYQAHLNLGNLLRDRQETERAVFHYRRTIEINPDLSLAYKNLGELFIKCQRSQEAIDIFSAWARKFPQSPVPLNGLGIALQSQGDYQQALQCFKQAHSIDAHRFETLNNLGTLLRLLHRPHDAIPYLQDAITLAPDSDLARSNLVFAFLNLGRIGEALSQSNELLARKPNSASGHLMKGFALTQLAQYEAAIDCYQKSYELEPTATITISNALFTLLYCDDLSKKEFVAARQKWVARLPKSVSPYTDWRGTRQANRMLKIGYLSGDLRSHPVSFFLEPILAHHHKGDFEITCYDVAGVADDVTERLKQEVHHWCTCVGWSDQRLAEKIYTDEIDILVDLSGHTSGNRVGVLHAKPAPIQILYIGYPGSTGLETVDYIISDELVSPAQFASYYQETVLPVEGSFWCFKPNAQAPLPGPLPAIENGFITFGSFNHSPKLSSKTLRLWSRLLNTIPNARLKLKSLAMGDDAFCEYFKEQFASFGADISRIDFEGPTLKLEEFFQSYHSIDIALDPTPYNGGTTTCEALWMGVPVITLRGERFCSRMSHSFLNRVGLGSLSADSEADYIDVAVNLSQDIGALTMLRRELRHRMAHSLICDSKASTLELEKAYRKVWNTYCSSSSFLV